MAAVCPFGRAQVMAAAFRPPGSTVREVMQEAGKRSAFAGPFFMLAGGIHDCNGFEIRPILKETTHENAEIWAFL